MIREPLEMIREPLETIRECLEITAAGILVSEQFLPGIHRLGWVQVVGQEAEAGWEWMCSSIFSHLQNSSSSKLRGEMWQGHKCLPCPWNGAGGD